MKSLRENVAYLKDIINNLQDLVQESENEISSLGDIQLFIDEVIALDKTKSLEFIWMSENTWEKFRALFSEDIDFLKDTEQRLRSLGYRGQYYNGWIVVADTEDRIITLKFKNSNCIDLALKLVEESKKDKTASLLNRCGNKEIGVDKLMPLTLALREASNGGLINCLTEYPTSGVLSDLKRKLYYRTFEFTHPFSVDGNFTDSIIAELHNEQDKNFIDVLDACVETSKQETSTVYKFDEKSFSTVRYLVERHRKSAEYLLFNRTQLSDMVRDQSFTKNMQIAGSRELMLEGLVGKFLYTKFKTTASTVTEEPIAPENIYALSSDGNGYHTRIETMLNTETRLVRVSGKMTIAIDPKSVAKLTIFKNI